MEAILQLARFGRLDVDVVIGVIADRVARLDDLLEPADVSLLENLSKAFSDVAPDGPFAGLAEGFSYIFKSDTFPEFLPLGLPVIGSALCAHRGSVL